MESVIIVCPKCGDIDSGKRERKYRCSLCEVPKTNTEFKKSTYCQMPTEQKELVDRAIREEHVFNSPSFDKEVYNKNITPLKEIQRRLDMERWYKAGLERESSYSTNIKCPTCQSSNVQKIGAVERGVSVFSWGLFSKKINKSFKCSACGYTW